MDTENGLEGMVDVNTMALYTLARSMVAAISNSMYG